MTEERRKLTTNDLAEIAAAARMAEKLASLVLDNQREIEKMLHRLEAMHWPENIFGQMESSLDRRDYEEIECMLEKWRQCREDDLPLIIETMKETGAVIQAFVHFFKKTNGLIS